MELDGTDTLGNDTVSAILVRRDSLELGRNDWVLPVRVGRVTHVGFEG